MGGWRLAGREADGGGRAGRAARAVGRRLPEPDQAQAGRLRRHNGTTETSQLVCVEGERERETERARAVGRRLPEPDHAQAGRLRAADGAVATGAASRHLHHRADAERPSEGSPSGPPAGTGLHGWGRFGQPWSEGPPSARAGGRRWDGAWDGWRPRRSREEAAGRGRCRTRRSRQKGRAPPPAGTGLHGWGRVAWDDWRLRRGRGLAESPSRSKRRVAPSRESL